MSDNKNDIKNEEKASTLIEYKNFDSFLQDGFKTLMEATRNANQLPKDRDYDFYKTHTSFNKFLSHESNRILTLVNKIIHRNDVEDNIKNRDFEGKIELIVEGNDNILERVANTIDEMNGLRKLPAEPVIQTVSAELPVNGSWNRVNKFSVNSNIQTKDGTKSKSIRLLTAQNIVRPQKFFKDKIENSNNYPWKPRITEKPNSLKPLALYMEDTEFGETYSHPYEFELERFVPSESFLKTCVPTKPKKIDDTPLHEITTVEQLDDLLEELRKHNEIAVDLEHHSYRSFMGITCLLQISTKDADYLIDTLALRDKLYVLNEVFTKNSIVKIFHGADMDIQWLQRDLSIYVVNMFDTHKAAKQLGYSGLSLSYLLNKFCSFMPNKQFQLADWRIRPLPEELKSYAREDTHYLIYIYNMLKNELLKQGNGSDNILKSVFQSSTTICMKRYFKPILTETSHLDFYRKCKRLFDNRQMYALKELYKWRDEISREEDESTGYVLPNHMLLQIAEMIPREVQGILACCNPIPPLVRAYSLELHHIILRAREQSLQKAIMKEDNRTAATKESIKLNIDSPLHCPHDLTKMQEFRDDLPTLLTNNKENKIPIANKKVNIEKCKSIFSIFNSEKDDKMTKKANLKFLGPYERYKLIKPFIQEEEAKAKAAKEAKEKAGEKIEDDPSIEDRIASLHQHFIKERDAFDQKQVDLTEEVELIPSEPKPEPPVHYNKSLVQMGGSKKRKRQQNSDEHDFHTDYQLPDNQLHTPIPNIQNSSFKRNKKQRKSNYKQNSDFKQQQQSDNVQQESDFNEQQTSNYNQHDYNEEQPDYNPQHQTNTPNRNANKRRYQQNGNQQNYRGSPGKRGGKRKGGNVPNDNSPNKQFKPFDYSSVNFNEFQGGAGGATRGGFNSNFKQKGKKKNAGGKFNNKSLTFGNGGGNKRGRGR